MSSNGVDDGVKYTHIHWLTGTGDTDNALFTIDGTSLRIKNTPAADKSSYNIRINVNDGEVDFSKTFIITVSDDPLSTDDFVTTWRVTAGQTITIPTAGMGYDYRVNWGDEETSTSQTGDATHEYDAAGTYTVRISGNFPRIYFGAGSGNDNSNSIIAINQWGSQQWTSMRNAFAGATNLEGQATDRPNLSRVTDMWGMFSNARNFNQDIGDWDVSNVTNMENMFNGAADFDQDISGWDVRNVTNMFIMFVGATAFNQNQNLGAWYIVDAALPADEALPESLTFQVGSVGVAGDEIATIAAQNTVLNGQSPAYTLSGDDARFFSLNNGVLTVREALPAGRTSYSIRISAAATGLFGTNNHRDLTLVVNPSPVITSPNGGVSPYEITLAENIQTVTTIARRWIWIL